MEWKSSADKEKYGDMIGEVIHHTLFESVERGDFPLIQNSILTIDGEQLGIVHYSRHAHGGRGV